MQNHAKALQRILIGIIDGMYYNVQWGVLFFGENFENNKNEK
jgi:hypothetical protein